MKLLHSIALDGRVRRHGLRQASKKGKQQRELIVSWKTALVAAQ